MNSDRPVIHAANFATLGDFGGWHWWCTCGAKDSAGSPEDAERRAFKHLLTNDPIRAETLARERNLGLFAIRCAQGLQTEEGRAGWNEAEAELRLAGIDVDE